MKSGPENPDDSCRDDRSQQRIVRLLYEAILQNRPEDFPAFVAATHVDHTNGRNGPAGFAGAAANLHRACSHVSIELEVVVAEEDWVVVRYAGF